MGPVAQERKLVTAIPGPRSQALHARRGAAVARGLSTAFPVYIESGSGAILVDVDGNALIDLGSGIAVTGVGHAAEPWSTPYGSRSVGSATPASWSPRTRGTSPFAKSSTPGSRGRGRSCRPCSIRGPRPSRTRSRSPGTPPVARPLWSSTTPTTAGPT